MLLSHTAVVAAGAVVALLSVLVVVTICAMVVLTVAYMPMCQGPERLAIEKVLRNIPVTLVNEYETSVIAKSKIF